MAIKQTLQSWGRKALGLTEASQLWLSGEDVDGDRQSTATRPYGQVELVFACVNKIISGIAGLPAVVSTIDDRVIESGPVYDALFNNESLSFQRFVTDSIGHFTLSGDVFWLFTETVGPRPKEIMVVSGTQMHPITHNRRPGGLLLGWEFRGLHGQRAQFALSECHQWKNFNPYDRFHGMAPLKAGKLSIDYSYAASLYNAAALANGAEPGIILTTTGTLNEDQVRSLRSQFDSRHKGAAKAKRTAVLTGGMDVKTAAMKMTDMEMAKISEMSDKKICSTFGVPPGVVGLITQAQYSHGPAMRDFIFNTIIPLARVFGGEVTAGILSKGDSDEYRTVQLKDAKLFAGNRNISLLKRPDYRDARHKAIVTREKIFLWFDSSAHPTVQEAQRETAEKVLKFTEIGVTLNDIIEKHDLPYEPVPWGDDWWIAMGLVPAKYTLEAGLEGLTGPSAPEGDGAESDGKSELADIFKDLQTSISRLKDQDDDDRRRLRIWRNWVVSWAGIERSYREALRKYFLRQQRILIAKLTDAMKGTEARAVKDRSDIVARVVFDLQVEDGKIKVINNTFFQTASELGIRQTITEASDLTGDALDSAVESAGGGPFIKSKRIISTQKITGINRVTQDLIAQKLIDGLNAGEDLARLTDRIRETLGSNRARALRIARTQTAGAVSTGRQAGMKSAGVKLKAWITSGDTEVRDSHRAAGKRYAQGISVDLPFNVAGELLMYPGDPSGSAGNIINCRCLSIARAAAGKTFDDDYYAGHTFYQLKG